MTDPNPNPDGHAELEALLAAVEATEAPINELEISGRAQALGKRLSDAGAELPYELRAEAIAFRFNEDHPDNGTGWGLYYGPMGSFQDGEGYLIEVPSIMEVTAEVLAYWSRRAREARHPVLRARYGDLAWEFAKKVDGARPDAEGARISIDAAVELADRPGTERMVGRIKLTRALHLARSLKDLDRVARVRDALIAFMLATAEDAKAGTWVYCFDQLIGERVPLAEGQEDQIISDLEARLRRLAGGDDGEGGDPWGAKDAAERLATYYRRNQRKDDLQRVLQASGAAFERLSRKAMPLVGAEWMREVQRLYREFGLTDDAKALDALLVELGQGAKRNLRQVSHSVEIPSVTFENLVKAVVGDDLPESLSRIAHQFLVDPERAEADVLRIAKEAPLQAMFRQIHLDDRGRPESEIGGVSDDLQGRVIAQMGQTIGFESIFLRHAIVAVLDRFDPGAADLTAHLVEAPVFEDSQRALIQRAFQAYVEQDWAAFAHLLVPQLEQAVRVLVLRLGGSHLAPHRGGGMKLRALYDLLREPTVEDVLGSKVVRYLQVVLTDPRGLNLRNAICHGYLPADRFGTAMADRLLHVALVLAELRAAPSPPSPTGDEAPE